MLRLDKLLTIIIVMVIITNISFTFSWQKIIPKRQVLYFLLRTSSFVENKFFFQLIREGEMLLLNI